LHEYVYADRILQSVLEEIGTARKPVTVTVEVGEMLGLTRESLTSAYKILAKGTRAEGSKLAVRFSRGSVECPMCGFRGRLSVGKHEHRIDPAFACPRCGSALKVSAGLEVKLVEIS
jgi:Zn finger protein HypA/HybF involved in hydrogenase expression